MLQLYKYGVRNSAAHIKKAWNDNYSITIELVSHCEIYISKIFVANDYK